MEKHAIKEDSKVLCKPVPEFPKGIQEAFEALIARFGRTGRKFYGISYMEKDKIIYKAAVSALNDDEAIKNGYELFTILKGDYLSESITDWMSKTDKIKDSFEQLMKDPRFNDSSPFIEWYENDKKMQCWVKMK